MAYDALRKKPDPDNGLAETPVSVEDMAMQTYSLARQVRQRNIFGDSDTRTFPNFTRIMKFSGRILLANDIIALFAALTFGGFAAWAMNMYIIKSDIQFLSEIFSIEQVTIFLFLGATALLWFDNKGHYRQRLPQWEMIGHVLSAAFVGFLVSGFIHFASKDFSSRLWIAFTCGLFIVFVLAGRYWVRRSLNRDGQWQIPAIMIGTGPTAEAAIDALKRESQMGFAIVGQVPSSSLGELEKSHAWKHMLMTHGACHVFLALEGGELEQNQMALKSMVRARVPCSIIPPWLGLPSSTLSPHHFMMQDVLLLHDTNRLQLPLARMLKRSFDLAVSGMALVVLAPLFVVVGLRIRRDGGPAFFKQARIGINGRLFDCYKFRSMRIDAEQALELHLGNNHEARQEWQQFQKLKNDVRITPFGQFIRRTSVDELPQLINVFKGEMSLVGPRPCMPGQEDLYADDFSFYEAVRPGITGPWQVSGRSRLTFKERVRLESWYARNWSFWMDIVILLKTVPVLLRRDGAF